MILPILGKVNEREVEWRCFSPHRGEHYDYAKYFVLDVLVIQYTKVKCVVLKITSGVQEYSLDCIQKLRRGKLDAALDVIRELFDQSRPLPNTTAVWSAAATAAGHYIGHVGSIHMYYKNLHVMEPIIQHCTSRM